MKKFKQADYFISLLLILVFVIISFINQDITWIVGYFVVGGWQVISMIIHAFFGWFTVKKFQKICLSVHCFDHYCAGLAWIDCKTIPVFAGVPDAFCSTGDGYLLYLDLL